MVRAPRSIRLAAGVTFLLAASPIFGADPPAARPRQGAPETPRKREGAAPARRDRPKTGEARLEAMRIVGAAELPAALFFLPRAKFRLLPLRPGPDPASRILLDDKLSAESPGS